MNTTKLEWANLIKPCLLCGFCPYGEIVINFPFTNSYASCHRTGYDCPSYYLSQPFCEEGKPTEEEYQLHNEELIRVARRLNE